MGAIVVVVTAGTEEQANLLGEELVEELHRDRTLADRGGDPLHRPVPHVARG